MKEKVRCIVIDDEPLAQDIIVEYISRFDFLKVIGKFDNALSAIKFLKKTKINLIFLDIQMPLLDGINFVKSLPDSPKIIFTTAHREYAVEGFELNAIDYLMKPIPFYRFVQAVNKIKPFEGFEKKDADANQAVFFRVDKKTVKVNYLDILLIESLKDYIKVVLANRSFITHQSLAGVLDLLPESHFVQVHKSYIINYQFVEAMEGNRLELAGHQIPIGRNYREKALHKIFGTGEKGWK